MAVERIGRIHLPAGEYIFPEGTIEGSPASGAADAQGLIPVYFRPKADSAPEPGVEEEEDAQGGHPCFRFSSREKWKKKRLMAKLHAHR